MKKNIKAMGVNRYKDVLGGVFYGLFIMAILIPFAEGCDYKNLVRDDFYEVTINVVYDWENAPEAYPEGMCIYFYNEDGSYYDRWDFLATKAADKHVQGGQIELPVGKYKVITYNNDAEGVYFSGMDNFSTHTAFTTENSVYDGAFGNTGGSPNSSRTSSRTYSDPDDLATDDTVLNNPSMMWGVTAFDVVITRGTISYTTTRASGNVVVKSADADMTLTLYPHELVATYTYDVINVHNLKYARLMFGKLSGMGSTLNLATGELGPEAYPVPFHSSLISWSNDEDGIISGSFLTFGNVGEVNYMVFYAMLTNGDNRYKVYDVTDQVQEQSAEDPMHVHILIDGMELPVAISDDDGFHSYVDDWQGSDIIVPL